MVNPGRSQETMKMTSCNLCGHPVPFGKETRSGHYKASNGRTVNYVYCPACSGTVTECGLCGKMTSFPVNEYGDCRICATDRYTDLEDWYANVEE